MLATSRLSVSVEPLATSRRDQATYGHYRTILGKVNRTEVVKSGCTVNRRQRMDAKFGIEWGALHRGKECTEPVLASRQPEFRCSLLGSLLPLFVAHSDLGRRGEMEDGVKTNHVRKRHYALT
jgi:hypothetical protein